MFCENSVDHNLTLVVEVPTSTTASGRIGAEDEERAELLKTISFQNPKSSFDVQYTTNRSARIRGRPRILALEQPKDEVS